MANGLGSGLLEIAMGLIGIALIALLVNRSTDTVKIVSQASSSFNDLLRTVTLQNGSGIAAGGMIY
jgi:hypothetical protein